MLSETLRDALPHLKYPSSAFSVAFKRALTALLDDAKASSYVPSPDNEDAYEYLAAILLDMKMDAMLDDEDAPLEVAVVHEDDDDNEDDFNFPDASTPTIVADPEDED